MRYSSVLGCGVWFFATALLVSTTATATSELQMDLIVEHSGVEGETELFDLFDTTPTGPISQTLEDSNAGYDGAAGGFADFGVLRASTELHVPGQLTNGASAGVGIQWADSVTVFIPGVPTGFFTGSMDFVVTYDGEFSGNPAMPIPPWNPIASLTQLFDLSVIRGETPAPMSLFSASCFNDCTHVGSPVSFPTTVSGELLVENFAFTVGVPVRLTVRASVNSFVGTAHFCGQFNKDPCDFTTLNAAATFTNTVEWGGIREVRDAQGVPLTSAFEILGESGFDYGAPVPEPSMPLLEGFALLATAILRRRARG